MSAGDTLKNGNAPAVESGETPPAHSAADGGREPALRGAHPAPWRLSWSDGACFLRDADGLDFLEVCEEDGPLIMRELAERIMIAVNACEVQTSGNGDDRFADVVRFHNEHCLPPEVGHA